MERGVNRHDKFDTDAFNFSLSLFSLISLVAPYKERNPASWPGKTELVSDDVFSLWCFLREKCVTDK